MQMTIEQKFDRLVYVQEWSPDLVKRLHKVCAQKNLFSPEEILEFAQEVAKNENLSSLRDGDASLDLLVAKAFDFDSAELMREFLADQKNQPKTHDNVVDSEVSLKRSSSRSYGR